MKFSAACDVSQRRQRESPPPQPRKTAGGAGGKANRAPPVIGLSGVRKIRAGTSFLLTIRLLRRSQWFSYPNQPIVSTDVHRNLLNTVFSSPEVIIFASYIDKCFICCICVTNALFVVSYKRMYYLFNLTYKRGNVFPPHLTRKCKF